MPALTEVKFDTGMRAGVFVIATFGVVSAIMVTLLLLHILSVFLHPILSAKKQENEEERVFLRMQLGAFIVCLLCSDFVQSMSGTIESLWAARGGIQAGPICTAQGAFLHGGDLGTAMWNAVVSVHTFMTVVLGKRMSRKAVISTIVFGWALVILITLLGPLVIATPQRGPFYGITTAWCFIDNEYALERILLHYFPMYLSAFTILLMYGLVFLTLRGSLVVDGWRWQFFWDVSKRTRGPSPASNQQLHFQALAKKMLWYPIVYIALVVPVSAARFAEASGFYVSPGGLLACITLLFGMGAANAIIYALTRRIGRTPWFARPVNKSSRSVQIYVDRVVTQADGDTKHERSTKHASFSVTLDLPQAAVLPPQRGYYPQPQRGLGFVMVDRVGTFNDNTPGAGVTFSHSGDNSPIEPDYIYKEDDLEERQSESSRGREWEGERRETDRHNVIELASPRQFWLKTDDSAASL